MTFAPNDCTVLQRLTRKLVIICPRRSGKILVFRKYSDDEDACLNFRLCHIEVFRKTSGMQSKNGYHVKWLSYLEVVVFLDSHKIKQ